MKIQKANASAFRKYGQVLEGRKLTGLIKEMKHTVPEDVIYVPSVEELEALDIMKDHQNKDTRLIRIGYRNAIKQQEAECSGVHHQFRIDMFMYLVLLMDISRTELDHTYDTSKIEASCTAGTGNRGTTLPHSMWTEQAFSVCCCTLKGTKHRPTFQTEKTGEMTL